MKSSKYMENVEETQMIRFLLDQCDKADKEYHQRKIQQALSKYGKPPPGEPEGIPEIHIPEREPALAEIDGHPVLDLYVKNFPEGAHPKDVERMLDDEFEVKVREVHIGRIQKSGKFPYRSFIRCKSVTDAVHLQYLSKSGKLLYRGSPINAYPANKSRQRIANLPPSRPAESAMKIAESPMNVSLAQTLPAIPLRLILNNLCLREKIEFGQVCQNWAVVLKEDKYFDWSPKHVWGHSEAETTSIETLSEMARIFNGVDFGWTCVILAGKSPINQLRIAATTEFIQLLNPNCLTELNLSGTLLAVGALKYIAKSLRQLRSFAIGNCTGQPDRSLSEIFTRNPLRAFGMFGNHRTTGNFLASAKNSETLTSITLRSCSKLNSPEIIAFFASPIALQSIEISQCQGLIPLIVNVISRRNNEQLKILRLDDCPREVMVHWCRVAAIDSTLMSREIPNNLGKNFQSLSLAHNNWVMTKTLNLISLATNISHVDLSYCSAVDWWWEALSHARNLSSLAINNLLKPLWDLGPNDWSNHPPTFSSFQLLRDKLEKLEFREYKKLKYMPKGIIKFFQGNYMLKVLDIRDCRNLSNVSFLQHVERCKERRHRFIVLRVFAAGTPVKYQTPLIQLDNEPYEEPENLPNHRLRQL